jgi:putative heme-binding domain-containing protein
VEMFSGRSGVPSEAISLFGAVASSSTESPVLRAKAVRALSRTSGEEALNATVAALTQPGKAPNEIAGAWEELARDTRQSRNVNHFIKLANSDAAGPRALACAVLANLAVTRVQDRSAKVAASNAVELLWARPESSVALLQAINRLRLDAYADRVRALTSDSNADIAAAARTAAKTLKLDQSTGDVIIEKLKYDDVLAAMAKQKGNAKSGADVFAKAGCTACHTMDAAEPPKGPFLGGIGTRYSRNELCESILKPSAKIAQGFETQWFKTKGDEEVEGFVTREGGDDLDVRNVAGIVTTLPKKNILERAGRETSIMPTGLVDKLTTAELASLLAYLEAAKGK